MVSVRDCTSWRAGRRRTATLLTLLLLVVLRCGRRPIAERARLLLLLVLRCGVGGGRRPNAERAEAWDAGRKPNAERAEVLECWDPPSVLLRRRAPAGLIGSSTACDNHSVMVSSGGGLGFVLSHW